MKILISSGGCEEPIDNVRSITNFSSGKTGSFLADFLESKGHEVEMVVSHRAIMPKSNNISIDTFKSFNDISKIMKSKLSNSYYDVVISCAAISDYSVESVIVDDKILKTEGQGKIDSNDNITIKLKRNPKIIDKLKEWSKNPKLKLIGFKLTSCLTEIEAIELVNKQIHNSKADLVVWNDLENISDIEHKNKIFNKSGLLSENKTKLDMADSLLKELEKIV